MIQWHEVTWYSRWGAIILFLVVVPVLCFYIGTQYELTQQALSIVPIQSVPEKPVATTTENISYPAGFSGALSEISTDGWKTYKNKNGWEIQYPTNWLTADCVDGSQVQFASHSGSVGCEGPSSSNFFIAGPMSQDQAMYNANKARIAQTINLNGISATRYLDALSGQSGADFSEVIVLQHNGQYFTLTFQKYLEYDLFPEKMISTFKFTQ